MRVRTFKALAAAAALAMSAGATAAQDQPYYNAGVDTHFYYSPRSVHRIGELAQVEWTDSKDKGPEKIVFLVHTDCTRRTIQSRADRLLGRVC